MKFVRFDGGRTGLAIERDGLQVFDIVGNLAAFGRIDDGAAARIGEVLAEDGFQSWLTMIAGWDDLRSAFASFERAVHHALDMNAKPLGDVALEAPLPSATVHIYGAGSNTVAHVQRAFKVMKDLDLTVEQVLKGKQDGKPPSGFTIWPDSVVGPGAVITPPPGFAKIDYESECAAYVKSSGIGLKEIEIWGYAGWNDFGIRDPHLGLSPESEWIPFSFNLPKNFDTGNACGPWVAVDEGNFRDARCKTFVNGEQRQDWSLTNMIYSFEEIFRFISTYQNVRPGDIVTSGTGLGVAIEGGIDGPNWLKAGDVVEVVVDGGGTLTNRIGPW